MLESVDPEITTVDSRDDFGTHDSWKKPKKRYSPDSYSLIPCRDFKEDLRFLAFGFFVFCFQIAFFVVINLSLFIEDVRAQGDVDNPNTEDSIFGNIIPSNASWLVHFTQFLAIVTFVVFAESSMLDLANGVAILPIEVQPKLWPFCISRKAIHEADRKEAVRIIVACGLRIVQGAFAVWTALLLILTSATVIEIVLNFATLNFVSNLDHVAFSLVCEGRFGGDLKREALVIMNGEQNSFLRYMGRGQNYGNKEKGKPLPTYLQENRFSQRFWFTIAACAMVMLIIFCWVVRNQLDEETWVTKTLRVEFGGSDLQSYSGCYKIDKGKAILRRNVYGRFDNESDTISTFAYCKAKRKWFLLNEDFDYATHDVCQAEEKELAHSRNTDSFDISTEFDENWYTAGGSALDVDFIELNKGNEDKCTKFGDGQCDKNFNDFQFGYDAGDCCSATCTNSNCEALKRVSVFGTSTWGVHFPACKDPKMRDITIFLDNFSSSYERKNLDLLYPHRKRRNDIHFDQAKDVEASTMTIECDGQYALLVDVDRNMTRKSQTIRVNDGANCTIHVERNIKDSACSLYCYRTEPPFWLFRYTVYEGDKVDDEKMILSQNSVENEVSPFWRIPECFSERVLFDNLTASSFYEDKYALDAFEWMARDTSGHSDCRLEFFPQRFHLIRFFSSLETPNQVFDGTSSCLWRGVTCNNDQTFHLDLTTLGFSGTFPKKATELQGLMGLTIINSQLTGTIPSEIGNLNQLQYLNLDQNSLSGSIPSEVGKISNLEALELAFNNLSGTVPTEIGNLHQLRCLDLAYNNGMIGSLPSEIGTMNQMQNLNLYRTSFSGLIPSEIGNMDRLEGLELRLTNLTGTIPHEIGSLTNLNCIMFDAPYINITKEVYAIISNRSTYRHEQKNCRLPDPIDEAGVMEIVNETVVIVRDDAGSL